MDMKVWTDKSVKAAKIGRHAIGGGLYLEVRDGRDGEARRSWLFRYQVSGTRRAQGLGSYPEIGLADARQRAADARAHVARGVDPIEARRASQQARRPVPTFAEIAALVIADAQAKSTNPKVRYQWERHLGAAYSGPLLSRPVNEITALDVAAVLGRSGRRSQRLPASSIRRSAASLIAPASSSAMSMGSSCPAIPPTGET
jgi:hypothetical protein